MKKDHYDQTQNLYQANEIILLARTIHLHYNGVLGEHGMQLSYSVDGKLSFDAAVRLATEIMLKNQR